MESAWRARAPTARSGSGRSPAVVSPSPGGIAARPTESPSAPTGGASPALGGTVWSVDFSPDGRRLLVAGSGGEVDTYDLKTGHENFILGHDVKANVWAAHFDRRGRRIVSGAGDGTAIVSPASGLGP